MVPLAAPHDEFITADTQVGSSGLLVGGSELMTPDPARTTDPSDVHEDLKERTVSLNDAFITTSTHTWILTGHLLLHCDRAVAARRRRAQRSS